MRIRGQIPLTILVLTLVPTVGRTAASIPSSVPEIVSRSIEFHGGETFAGSESSLRICSKSGCFKVAARINGGLYELEAEGLVRGELRKVWISNDSVRLWLDGEERPVAEDAAQPLRNWVMSRVYFIYLPFRLRDPSVVHEDLGLEVWDDRPLRKVKVSFVPGSSAGAEDEFLYWFDPETARLEQFAYSFAENDGGLRFRRAFNYRRVGGLLFFDQLNLGIDGEDADLADIDPGTVATWKTLSTVTLRDIEVSPLGR